MRLIACLGALALAACSSIGPATISRDRLGYSEALADAGKREMLLNVVKLRFGDVPSLTSVDHIVAGYSVESRINAGTDLFRDGYFFLSDDLAVSAGGTFSDRPTITYRPVKGSEYARTMLAPLPPGELIAMLTSGAPVDETLRLTVKRINGLTLADQPAMDPTGTSAYLEALGLLEALRVEGILGIQFEEQADERSVFLLIGETEGPVDPRVRRLRELLDLPSSLYRFRIVFGFHKGRPDELMIYTRSLFAILSELGAGIEVPETAVRDGRTYATREPGRMSGISLRVRSEPARPADAFVAVEYDGSWYAIDDRDFASKRAFGVLMLLAAVMERSGPSRAPVITIPTG